MVQASTPGVLAATIEYCCAQAMSANVATMNDCPLYAYSERQRVPVHQLPVSAPVDHTMAHDLDAYVAQRIPVHVVRAAARDHIGIEVHGVHPLHLPEVAQCRGWRSLAFLAAPERPGKRLNSVRPALFGGCDPFGSRKLIMAVPPGEDYVRHYGGLLRHLLRHETVRVDEVLSIWRYPNAENTIAEWTGLGDTVLCGAKTVVFGKVSKIAKAMDDAIQPTQPTVFTHYTAWTYATNGRTICLLGVHFSYWGSIAGKLARRCVDLGADEILYAGKLGALTSPTELYGRLFVPSRYAILSGATVRTITNGPPNGILAHSPALDSGLHVSVPTVIEEDFHQREVAAALGATTIDNEISQMAAAIDDANLLRNTHPVGFSALHYATDYLRRPNEIGRRVRHSLARGRKPRAVQRRWDVEASVGSIITNYLATHKPSVTRTHQLDVAVAS